MRQSDARTYRTRQFAELAGVTVRALHHYDRLGLLKPRRTQAGYRVYSARDFERLEQIIALKFIGVPLKKIRFFTAGTPGGLAQALRAQRLTLEEKKRLLEQAIEAIRIVEGVLHAGKGPATELYRRIIEVIEKQNNSEAWKKKYDTLVQAKIARLTSLSPDALAELRTQWGALITDIQAALAEDPAGPDAQKLATRWVSLLERLMGGPIDPSMIGSAAAFPNPRDEGATANVPGLAPYTDTRVWDFMNKALAARR